MRQGLREVAPLAEAQLAMAERQGEHLAHLRHATEDGKRPGGREHVDGARRIAGLEPREERLGEDGVADPGGRDDEGVHGA